MKPDIILDMKEYAPAYDNHDDFYTMYGQTYKEWLLKLKAYSKSGERQISFWIDNPHEHRALTDLYNDFKKEGLKIELKYSSVLKGVCLKLTSKSRPHAQFRKWVYHTYPVNLTRELIKELNENG